jgi:hypothetical protein
LNDSSSIGEIDGLPHGEVDQVGLFVGGDDLHEEAELLFHFQDKVAAVGRFADRGSRVGQDDIAIEAGGDALVAGEDLQGMVHRPARQAVVYQGGGAQLRQVLFRGEDLERQALGDLHDHHVQGIGADVDGGDPQAVGGGGARRPGKGGRRRLRNEPVARQMPGCAPPGRDLG